MLKRVIASLDDVEEKYRSLYTEQADGTFKLGVEIEGLGDVTGLKNNNYELKKEKLRLQEQLDEAKGKLAEHAEGDLLSKEKYEELLGVKEAAWEGKLKASNERVQVLEGMMKTSTVGAALSTLATELAGERAPLIMPHLKSRLSVVEENGQFATIVLDANGQPSGLSVEQLAEEFRNNPVYAPILKGRDSSGSGGGGEGQGAGDAALLAAYEKYFTQAEYNSTKQGELREKDKALYEKLVKKYDLDNIFTHVPTR